MKKMKLNLEDFNENKLNRMGLRYVMGGKEALPPTDPPPSPIPPVSGPGDIKDPPTPILPIFEVCVID
jgi:hypothetical protein